MKSTSRFGACDLDTRPPAMFPFTIFLQRCEHCGYVAPKISDGNPEMLDFVKSEFYKTCDGIEPKSDTAKDYIRYAILQGYNTVGSIMWPDKTTEKTSDKGIDKVFLGYLNAAWACDDAVKPNPGDPSRHKCMDDAEKCRRKCLDLIDMMIVEQKEQKEKETLLGIKADLLRRTGQFDAVIEEFENKSFQDQIIDQVIKFEVARAKEKDAKRYTMDHIAPLI
jgi:hypothetical protein